LERLPWRFYWQDLNYSVDHYPNAEVILRVYTLSSEEGLFGV
jgi:MSHA biogenesis protein MshJ